MSVVLITQIERYGECFESALDAPEAEGVAPTVAADRGETKHLTVTPRRRATVAAKITGRVTEVLPVFYLAPEKMGYGLALAAGIGLASGIIPALTAMRLRIVDALLHQFPDARKTSAHMRLDRSQRFAGGCRYF